MFKRLHKKIYNPGMNPSLTLFNNNNNINTYTIFKYKLKQNLKIIGFLLASFTAYKSYNLFINHQDINIPLYHTYDNKLYRNIILQDLLDNDINLFYIENLIKKKLLKIIDNEDIKLKNNKLQNKNVKINNDNNYELFTPIKYLTISYNTNLLVNYNILLTINPFKVINKILSSLSKENLNTSDELLLMNDNAEGNVDGSHHLSNNITKHYQLLIKNKYSTNQNQIIEYEAIVSNNHHIQFNSILLMYQDTNGNWVKHKLV
ncbi:hypothetical protein D499_0C00830 [Hanseniaspora uvarum DSM 2768]|nr:hypothetical protein D499_0C00830 [Hanseniaspora uvarum DSM 2768]